MVLLHCDFLRCNLSYVIHRVYGLQFPYYGSLLLFGCCCKSLFFLPLLNGVKKAIEHRFFVHQSIIVAIHRILARGPPSNVQVNKIFDINEGVFLQELFWSTLYSTTLRTKLFGTKELNPQPSNQEDGALVILVIKLTLTNQA